ncbi:MAG: hypothetical protein J6S14_22060 [Clostridia bacterium]|nr:hypothetical protein [Clostridia bacterium]
MSVNKTEQARELRRSLKSIIKSVLLEDPTFQDLWHVRRATVVTAPNGSTCGVRFVGETDTINLAYSSDCASVSVGDAVLVGIIGNTLSNGIVWQTATFGN